MTAFDDLPTDAFAQVWHRLTPTSRLMLRQSCSWARRMADELCLSLTGVTEAAMARAVDATNGISPGSRLINLKCLAMSCSGPDAPQLGDSAGAMDQMPAWPILLSRLASLRQLTLTGCQRLEVAQMHALAAGCPALVALRVQRGPTRPAGAAPLAAAAPAPPAPTPHSTPPGPGAASPGLGPLRRGHVDGLMRRPAPEEPWALSGLTFAPLAACTRLREVELYDTPPTASRPTGLPPGALLSLGGLTQLRGLALHGASPDVDLCCCLSRLTTLTRLELALLPCAWERGGMRRRQAAAPSLARHGVLRALRLRLLAATEGCGGGGGGRHATALPQELYDMLLSVNHGSLEVLHLDLPPPLPPRLAAAAAAGAGGGGGGGAAVATQPRPLGRLAPLDLACSPEILELLVRDGMSLRQLEALRLRGWLSDDGRPTGREAAVLASTTQGSVSSPAPAACPSRHVPEPLVQWAFRRVAASTARVGADGADGTDGAAALYGMLRRDAEELVATGGVAQLRELVRHARWVPPTEALPEGLRLHISLSEGLAEAQRMSNWWGSRAAGAGRHQAGQGAGAGAGAGQEAAAPPNERVKCYQCLPTTCLQLDLDLRLTPAVHETAWIVGPYGPGFGGHGLVGPQPPDQVAPPVFAPPPESAGSGSAAALAAAAAAAARSQLAAPLRWLPYQLPDLHGLTLSYNAVDERGVAMLAAGLTALRRLALGRVELKAAGRGALKPLGSLHFLTSLRFGNIRVTPPQLQQPAATASAAAAEEAAATATATGAGTAATAGASAAPGDGSAAAAAAPAATAAVLRELEDCCTSFAPRLLPPSPSQLQSSSSPSPPPPLASPLLPPWAARSAAAGAETEAETEATRRRAMVMGVVMVVVVPPPGISLEQALKFNRRLEAATAGSGCAGPGWAAAGLGAQLSLLERGLDSDVDSDLRLG